MVDDGSAPEVRVGLESPGLSVRVLRLAGVGRSAARNAGAEAAGEPLLIFIDDDITVAPDFVETHLRAQREWPGVLGAGAIRLPPEIAATPFGRFRRRLEESGEPASRGLSEQRNLCAAGNMSIARDAFLALGGFDATIASGEDQDFALRHSARGGRIAFLPDAEVIHRDSALDLRSYCRRVEWGAEHVVAFCRRHPEWPDNRERERVNGPVRIGREPVSESVKKLAKVGLGTPPVVAVLFGLTRVLERFAPESAALERLYEVLLGVHILRGFRRGATRVGLGVR